jgi:hypothetical protein
VFSCYVQTTGCLGEDADRLSYSPSITFNYIRCKLLASSNHYRLLC